MNRSGKGWGSMSLAGRVEPAAEPSEWEKLMRELELPEEQALSCVQRGDSRGTLIVKFVRSCFWMRYIPEPVLNELGLAQALESTQLDNRNRGKHLLKRLATVQTARENDDGR